MHKYRQLIEFMQDDIRLCEDALRTDRALGRSYDRKRRMLSRINKQREIEDALWRLGGLEK